MLCLLIPIPILCQMQKINLIIQYIIILKKLFPLIPLIFKCMEDGLGCFSFTYVKIINLDKLFTYILIYVSRYPSNLTAFYKVKLFCFINRGKLSHQL